jgi:wobble nucleotide-excising tRNase
VSKLDEALAKYQQARERVLELKANSKDKQAEIDKREAEVKAIRAEQVSIESQLKNARSALNAASQREAQDSP